MYIYIYIYIHTHNINNLSLSLCMCIDMNIHIYTSSLVLPESDPALAWSLPPAVGSHRKGISAERFIVNSIILYYSIVYLYSILQHTIV